GGGVALLDGTNVNAWSGAPPTVNAGVTNSLPSAPTAFSNFFSGNAHLPGVFMAGTSQIMKNFLTASQLVVAAENRAGGNCCGWTPFNGNYNNFIPGPNNQSEETTGAYGVLRFGHDLTMGGSTIPMDGNLGLRVVSTQAQGSGNGVFTSPGNLNNA